MTEDVFENNHREIVAERVAAETLIVDVDGYEGPLDLLLTLSRTQKVDLRKISILFKIAIAVTARPQRGGAVWRGSCGASGVSIAAVTSYAGRCRASDGAR